MSKSFSQEPDRIGTPRIITTNYYITEQEVGDVRHSRLPWVHLSMFYNSTHNLGA